MKLAINAVNYWQVQVTIIIPQFYLNCWRKLRKTGTRTVIVDKLKKIAVNKYCKRIYLMTTNDNFDSLSFCQKRGFTVCEIHLGSVKFSRKIEPTTGMIEDHGTPVRDEVELEFLF